MVARREMTSRPLFDRFIEPISLRARGAFHWLSAIDSGDGQRRTIVHAGPGANASVAAAALERCMVAHNAIAHRCVPSVIASALTDGTPWIAFECAAIADGDDLRRSLADHDRKVPYEAADGFIASLRNALEAAHATADARGRPRCLGRLSLSNVLFDATGQWFLVGFGANLPIEKENGSVDGSTVFFQAPELAVGGEPTPVGDYIALLQLRRSVIAYAELPPRLARILRGEIQDDDRELLRDLQWIEQRLVGGTPADRPSFHEAIAVADRIRVALDTQRDEHAMRSIARAALDEPEAPAHSAHATGARRAITVTRDCGWVTVGHDRQRLGSALRRVLQALVAQHQARPGVPLTVWELLSAGWPGEEPLPDAGANRVYVTVNRLRSVGLRAHVERFDDGYRIAPDVELNFE